MTDKQKILLIDFMYLWNRIYAIKGELTAPHIYASLKHVDESDYYKRKIAILDGEYSSDFRRQIYSEYKTNRSDKSESYESLENFLSKNAVNFKTIHFVRNDSYEADDVITAFVKKYSCDKYIYSGDTDLYQLLRFDNTYVGTNYSRGMIIEPVSKGEALRRYNKKYNVNIKDYSYITKVKTFKGDSGDNIPIACPGMKTKTLDILFEKFWAGDEPLSSSIMLNMANYLKEHGTQREFDNFFDNRKAIIRNYKLIQLGYGEPNVFDGLVTLQESGSWE